MSDIPINVEFALAIETLPEVPSIAVLAFLSSAAYSVADIEAVKQRGLELQRIHGLNVVPPVAECQWAAGLWDIIRTAILEARNV